MKLEIQNRGRAMKCLFLALLTAALALVAQAARAELITLDFANQPDTSILFTGTDRSVTFPSSGGYNFTINNSSLPQLVGYQGKIDGTFLVGNITTVVSGVETAPLTGTGTFSFVTDSLGETFTASLQWNDITVYNKLSGITNGTGEANLGNVQYAGSDPALLAIKNSPDLSVVLAFQFSPATKKSLTQLMLPGQVNGTSYSGSLSATPVPEPSSCVLGGIAVGLVLLFRSRRRAT
jgi:hypothetical protein